VLHAVPVGDHDSDIDHVVIGPGGVFTINAKNHPQAKVWVGGDVVMVNGSKQFYVRNSRFEAWRAAKLLSDAAHFDVEVRGIVAVTGERSFTVKQQPEDGTCTVVRGDDLVKYLRRLPPVLGAPSIDRIYAVARHLATWRPNAVRWADFDVTG
jgi:hypothetical protein